MLEGLREKFANDDLYMFIKHLSRYYECDEDVMNDFELQNFMNEVSADGTGSHGGLGNVRKLIRFI